jgi:hypothetical protein
MRIATAVLSYNSQLGFGITGDYDCSAEVKRLAAVIEASIEQLAALARGLGPAAVAERADPKQSARSLS